MATEVQQSVVMDTHLPDSILEQTRLSAAAFKIIAFRTFSLETFLNANLQVYLDAPTNSAISSTSKISHLLEDFFDEDIAHVPLFRSR